MYWLKFPADTAGYDIGNMHVSPHVFSLGYWGQPIFYSPSNMAYLVDMVAGCGAPLILKK